MTQQPAWHADAIRDLEETSMSVSEIAKKYNRSTKTVEKLLYTSNIVRKFPNSRRGPTRRENSLPISRQHHAIGIRLNMLRGPESSRVFADRLGVSPNVLAKMEVGQHDFQLTQLLTISKLMGQPINELIQTFDNNLYSGRTNVRH